MKKLWLIFYFIPSLFAQAQTSEEGPIQIEIGDLAINCLYQYRFALDRDGQSVVQESLLANDLKQSCKPPPDFICLTGSCTYFNQPVYDRHGKSYGGISEKQQKP